MAKRLTKLEKTKFQISEGIYEAIKKYRDLSESEIPHYSRGILDQKETWLLERIEHIIFGVLK